MERHPPEQITPDYELNAGEFHLWPRYEEYKLESNSILPVSGAKLLFYDPWLDYKAALGRERVARPPYVSLLNLTRSLSFRLTPYSLYQPTGETARNVVDWCNHFGLLGIVPATYQQIVLSPEPVQAGRGAPSLQPGITQRRHYRESGYWQTRAEQTGSFQHATDAEMRTTPSGSAARELSTQKGSVRVWQWEHAKWTEEELGHNFFRFFPAIAKEQTASFQYPMPTSDAFWLLYSEPLDIFCHWAVRFSEAVQILAGATLPGPGEEMPFPVWASLEFMSSLAGSLGLKPLIDPGAKRLKRVRHSPALLCSFAEMFLQDMEAGRRVKTCPSCNDYFVARDDQPTYCSTRCRNTVQRRRNRLRIRPLIESEPMNS